MSAATMDRIATKIEAGEPLTAQDVGELCAAHDILMVGSLADSVRRRRHGRVTTFVRVAEVPGAGGDFLVPPDAREVRLTAPGGSETEALAAVRRAVAAAGGLPVTGFCLASLERAVVNNPARLESVLKALKAEGLETLAEAPIDGLVDWKRAMHAAAAAGVRVPRLTVDTPALGLAAVLERAADAHRTFGTAVFAPLPRHPGPQPTTGYEDVKSVAVSRIVLGGLDHIQVDWRLHGPKLAQVALTVGADDVDNVPAGDDPQAGPRRSRLEEILRNIRAAGLEPAERDAAFNRLS